MWCVPSIAIPRGQYASTTSRIRVEPTSFKQCAAASCCPATSSRTTSRRRAWTRRPKRMRSNGMRQTSSANTIATFASASKTANWWKTTTSLRISKSASSKRRRYSTLTQISFSTWMKKATSTLNSKTSCEKFRVERWKQPHYQVD